MLKVEVVYAEPKKDRRVEAVEEVESSGHPAAASRGPKGPTAILIVEDDEDMAASIRELITMSIDDVDVRLASSAEEGWEVLEARTAEEPIDVVISDYDMPGMNGLEFLRKVRREHPDVARVMVTAHVRTIKRTEAVEEGDIQQFLVKPVDSTNLVETLKYILRGEGPPGQGPNPFG